MNYMENYEEVNREDFIPEKIENVEIPVAQISEEETNKLLLNSVVEEEENYLKIVFDKPYDFEGDIFQEIDLSELENINGRQLTVIEKAFGKLGVIASLPESTATYAKIVAAAITGLPAEFFEDLPGKEVRKIKAAVTRFFFVED